MLELAARSLEPGDPDAHIGPFGTHVRASVSIRLSARGASGICIAVLPVA
jgi:hypothetical protein